VSILNDWAFPGTGSLRSAACHHSSAPDSAAGGHVLLSASCIHRLHIPCLCIHPPRFAGTTFICPGTVDADFLDIAFVVGYGLYIFECRANMWSVLFLVNVFTRLWVPSVDIPLALTQFWREPTRGCSTNSPLRCGIPIPETRLALCDLDSATTSTRAICSENGMSGRVIPTVPLLADVDLASQRVLSTQFR
jgi:hypothetical protein